MLYFYNSLQKKQTFSLIIITYKCGFSNKYFIKNKKIPTKTKISIVENHTKPKNMQKILSKLK